MTRQRMLIAWAVAAFSCSDAGSTDQHALDPAGDTEADDDFKGCPEDIPPFGPGLFASSDHFAATLRSAMPVEPERYSRNRWEVELSASDATITHGQTFMPIHGHDGRVEPQITALSEPGGFLVDRLNFTMRGPWEVRLWLSAPGVNEELAVFHICVSK